MGTTCYDAWDAKILGLSLLLVRGIPIAGGSSSITLCQNGGNRGSSISLQGGSENQQSHKSGSSDIIMTRDFSSFVCSFFHSSLCFFFLKSLVVYITWMRILLLPLTGRGGFLHSAIFCSI